MLGRVPPDSPTLRVRVLGSAAGGGLPQWNCGCANCVRARAGDAAVPPRAQPSIAVSADGVRWSIVNAAPDVREQMARFPGLHPRAGTRDVPLDTVVVTNPDIDHVLGLLVLREALPYRIVSTPFVRDLVLDHNAVYRILAPAWGVAKLDQPVQLDRDGHLEARLFPVPGKVPTWAASLAPNHPEATCAVRITDTRTGRRLVYAPGVAKLDAGTLAELEAAACVFVDGTFFTTDELIRSRPGAPDAFAMGHAPISGPGGTLAVLAELRARKLYVHMNNTNPVLDAGSEAAALVRRAGIEIAMDGMELTV
jgi:pyrroloquinoline quinone biosynthesis protein B